MRINDFFELSFGTGFFFILLVSCIVVSNKFISLIIPKNYTSRNINILLLILHLIIIVAFVIAIRSLFYKYIKNKDILNGIFSLTGPIIGISSLYMSDTLHAYIS